ncbi:hypothetical protein RyT2_18370 [Pseudolactococcus yaeyamensis]
MNYNDPLIWLSLLIVVLMIFRVFGFKEKGTLFPIEGFRLSGTENVVDNLQTIFWQNNEMLACLTSGVGQKRVGELSCKLAEETVRDNFSALNVLENPHDFLKRCCLESHRKISENINVQSGGCSIALIYIKDRQLFWVSSGNISIYLYDEKMTRLNKRDLYKYKLRDKILDGQISERRVLTNTLKNELTSYLGYENFRYLEGNKQSIKLNRYQKVVVCNKEIDDTISELSMEKVLDKSISTENKLEKFKTLYQELRRQTDNQATFILAEKFK